jgi:glycosyltransferase involved in cell wall biosynthesis
MIQTLLNQTYAGFELLHVRMAFSKEMDEIGRFRVGKLFELVSVILQILRVWFSARPRILYYPPAGPNFVPVVRDIVILCIVRHLFKVTIFHFEASGLCEIYPRLSRPLQFLFRLAYFSPEIVVRLSEFTPEDGRFLQAKHEVIVPNCSDDLAAAPLVPPPDADAASSPVKILFTGVVCEEKGVSVLLDALGLLHARGIQFTATIMGKFESPDYAATLHTQRTHHQLDDHVEFVGVLSGVEKIRVFRTAEIFCFPTFFSSEGFSVVLVEAMSCALPVVTTDWRGLRSIVVDGETGYLVPIRDPAAVANKLEQLIADPALRRQMGDKGRARYDALFTVESYRQNFLQVFTLAQRLLVPRPAAE